MALTSTGRDWLDEALDTPFEPGRLPLTRACLDWTERWPHVAGAHVCTAFLANDWLRRVGTSRAVVVTRASEDAIERLAGVDVTRVA